MNYAELKDEVAARGFDYLTDTRCGQYVNWARAELDDYARWPYRESSATGLAPLAIADLGQVEAVLDTTAGTVLEVVAYRNLLDFHGDLLTAGSPAYWYPAQPASDPVVATYPVSATAVIGVQYWRVPPDLAAPGDEPLAPARWHRTIVDIAVRMAYRDSDNHESAESIQAQVDRDLATMYQSLMRPEGRMVRMRYTEWSY